MKHYDWFLFLPLGLVLSIAASALTGALQGDRAGVSASDRPAPDTGAARRLELEVAALRAEQDALREELDGALASASGATSVRREVGGLDAAVERWMRENAASLLGPVASDSPDAPGDRSEDEAVDAAIETILDGRADQAFWTELRADGRLDAVIAQLEAIVETSPNDPDLRTQLARSYQQKSFEVGPGPRQALLNEKADAAFDAALALDDSSWDARFGKAIALSNWPAFQGKAGEAIHNFEILVEQQEARPTEDRFENTYFYLGNMYLEAGQPEKALRTWRRGREFFPESQRLVGQIATEERKAR